jgi:hypothetical protein
MANGHGGAREDSGPDKKPPELNESPELETDDPIEFLRALMRDKKVDIKLRQDSAKRLLAFEKRKPGQTGKKGEQKQAAADASSPGSRFAPIPAPKLRAVK